MNTYNNNACSTKNTLTLEKPYKNFFNEQKTGRKSLNIKKNELKDIINFQAFSKNTSKKRKTLNINFIKSHNEYISKIRRGSNASVSSINIKNDSMTDKDI